MSILNEVDSWYESYQAYKAGIPFIDNPYKKVPDYFYWREGWNKASQEADVRKANRIIQFDKPVSEWMQPKTLRESMEDIEKAKQAFIDSTGIKIILEKYLDFLEARLRLASKKWKQWKQ